MSLKVILLQEIPGLGNPGEIKAVASGYARNFLLPREMVTLATPAALANLQERVATEQRRRAKILSELQELTDRVNTVKLKFAVRVGSKQRLYGSVTNQDISAALRQQENIIVDRRSIVLSEPLRTLGTFKVPVRLGNGFEPQLSVELVGSEGGE